MKLSINAKYLEELRDSYGEGEKNTISSGYGYHQKAFSFMPAQYVILANSDKMTLITLSGLTLNVKSTDTYTRSDLSKIKAKRAFMGKIFEITSNEGKKIKFRINKTVFGITKYQESIIEKLNQFSNCYS
jgi:hypothetical protein